MTTVSLFAMSFAECLVMTLLIGLPMSFNAGEGER